MYLTKLAAQNIGPFENALTIKFPFNEAGLPGPIVLVGRNGAGKTTILAHVADALYEFCADHFNDLLPQHGLTRAYFKVCGPTNQRSGSPFGFFFLEFRHGDNAFQYLDKTGALTLEELQAKLGGPLTIPGWQNGESQKLSSDSKLFREIFVNEVHAFFPAHRFEHPNWLNSERSQIRDGFSFRPRFSDRLDKPLVVAQSAESNRGWMLDVLLDMHNYQDASLWEASNIILRAVLGRPDVRFGVGPRTGASRVSVCNAKGDAIIPTMSHLSGGQASLLSLFLTILRYGDKGRITKLDEITGIVMVDEIEGHLDTRLQCERLPSLIKLFPRMQFIITSHSPLFLLGMERALSPDGFEVIDLPSSRKISPTDFCEYHAIVDGLNLVDTVKTVEKDVVVFVEGETDKTILDEAWKKLCADRLAPFVFVNAYSCTLIRATLKRNEVFDESPTKTFIGLLDFDDAYNEWNSAVNERKERWQLDPSASDETGRLAKHPVRKGFLALLPVPQFRSQFAGERYGSDSCVSIELLFPDEYLVDCVREREVTGGGKKLEFRDDRKAEFAAKVASLPVEAFGAFKAVFALLEDIIGGRRPGVAVLRQS